ncbi:MAG: TonB-dependent receptor [Bacteroidota bacterium]
MLNSIFNRNSLYVFLFLLCFCLGSALYGQTRIEGMVRDSLSQALGSASVMLLQVEDSVMEAFALSRPDGTFQFSRIKAGKYLVQVSYLGYAPSFTPVKVTAGSSVQEIAPIELVALTTSLEKITITGDRTPIRIRRDTIEYNADAFNTQPNDVVEDLLKKLPGVEVNRDGSIKAQGENVQKVLVEGKEFFGDDPRIATKNLPADAIDKVQVFDKQSDMAEFTGIEDGQDAKTINLALKEGKKVGVFGKLGAAYGTDERYRLRGNLNKFDKKLQLSFIGNANNINQQGFSFEDYVGFMGGLGSGMSFSPGNGEGGLLNSGRSDGFLRTSTAGVNFNYELGPKTEFRSSYFFNQLDQDRLRTSQRENLLTDNPFTTIDNSDLDSKNLNHRINFFLKHKLDSTQQLIYRGNATFNHTNILSESSTLVRNPEGGRENSNDRTNASNGDRIRLNNRLTYRKRFEKKGRTTALSLELNTSDNRSDLDLSAVNIFFPDRTRAFMGDSVFQTQVQREDQLNFGINWNYTEPIGKGWIGGLTYSFRNYSNDVVKDFFDLDRRFRNRRLLNTELSNAFNQEYLYHRPGVSLQRKRNKWFLQAKLEYQSSRLQGNSRRILGSVDRTFNNLLPSFSGSYEFSTSRNLEVKYSTQIREPSVAQLQPIVDNSNPLFIYRGNPNLRPSYIHIVSINYFSFIQYSQTNLFARLMGTYTQDQIVQAIEIDSLFRQNIRPINVSNDYLVLGYISFGTPIKPLGIRMGVDLNYTYNRGFAFINSVQDRNTRHNRGIRLKLENRKKEIIDIVAGGRFSESRTSYVQSSAFSQRFFTQQYFLEIDWNITPTTRLGSTLDYDIYSGESFGARQTLAIWQVECSQYILENQRGEISLQVFDLLNQNQGINRSTQLTFVEEERIVSLGRYLLLGFTYSLSKFGLKHKSGAFKFETNR